MVVDLGADVAHVGLNFGLLDFDAVDGVAEGGPAVASQLGADVVEALIDVCRQ